MAGWTSCRKVILLSLKEDYTAEFEIYIFTQYRNSGYGSEIIRVLIGLAFSEPLSCVEVTAITRPDNIASIALLERFGFSPAMSINKDSPILLDFDEPEKGIGSILYHLTKEMYYG